MEILAQETAKPYVYSSPYNILALASVIGQPIFAVYPDEPSALSMKLAMHGFYFLRKAAVERSNLDDIKSNAIYVMWTRTNLLPIKPWQPNHFVLLRTQNQFTPVKSYTKAAAAANYKKPSRTISSRPETEDSHLSKVKWRKRKMVTGDEKEPSRTSSTTLPARRARRPADTPTKAKHLSLLHQQVPQILAVPIVYHPADRPTNVKHGSLLHQQVPQIIAVRRACHPTDRPTKAKHLRLLHQQVPQIIAVRRAHRPTDRQTNKGRTSKTIPPTGFTKPSTAKSTLSSRQTNESQTVKPTPSTSTTNPGSTKSLSTGRQTNEGHTVPSPRKRYFYPVTAENPPSGRHSQENVDDFKLPPNKKVGPNAI